jgi:site-specific DNA recombinase
VKSYFGYTRVSTTKQGERSVSLPEQKEAIERYAGRNELNIVSWFEEQQTAAKKGRPIWSNMLKLLRKGKVCGVVIHKIDRSARNLKDWADLGELIDQGIEVHFANEALDLASRGGRLSADIQAVVAADYIRNLREEAKKGIYGRLKQGFYPLRAPIGYKDNGQAKAKTIDPVRGVLVRKAFELYHSMKFSIPTLCEEMFHQGLRNLTGGRVSRNGMSTILRNPFYTGLIRIKRTNQTFQGNHEPLISRQVFEEVQAILDGRLSARPQKHSFLFRKIVKCKTCGYSLIGERKKGHVYYRCHTRTCPQTSVREEAIETAVMENLQKLVFREREIGYWKDAIVRFKEHWIEKKEQQVTQMTLKRQQVSDRINRLTDVYIDQAIERDIFEERKAALLAERQEIDEALKNLSGSDQSVLYALQNFLELAGSAYFLYQNAILEKKREMVKTVTSNLRCIKKPLNLLSQSRLLRSQKEKTLLMVDHLRTSLELGMSYSCISQNCWR